MNRSVYSVFRTVVLVGMIVSPLFVKGETDVENPVHGPSIDKLHLETRLAWEGENIDGTGIHDNTGFKGQFFNLRFDGQIVDGLTFSYRQRLNKQTRQTFWDATDWIHLDWQINGKWGLSAGKQVVALGGYEYDRAPIDLYYCSEFWYHIACYQFGLSGSFQPTVNDKVIAQMCNSPFRQWAGNNTYGLNFLWYGKHAWWESMWSASILEHQRGQWMTMFCLGNRFNISRNVLLDVDYTNRSYWHHTSFFKDFTLTGEFSVMAHESTRVYAKYTYDQNKSGSAADMLVTDGTSVHRIGAGFEVSPVRKYRDGLRVFGAAMYGFGDNTNAGGVVADKQLMVQAGVKFRLDIWDAINRVVNNKKK